MKFGAVDVRVSEFAVQTVSVKKHKHRRSQRLAYHLRIQKKWDKRFGRKNVPGALMMNWAGREVLVVHPAVYGKLLEAGAR